MKQECQDQTYLHEKIRKSKKIFKIQANKSSRISKGPIFILHPELQHAIFEEEEESKQQAHELNILALELKKESFQIEQVLNLTKSKQTSGAYEAAASRPKYFPLFLSNFYDPMDQIDFDIYSSALTRSRIYSVILVDKYGKIIYSDKLGHELFEGSLNNFQRVHIQDLIVAHQQAEFCQTIKHINEQRRSVITKMLIYSKNAKRRYSREEFINSISDDEIYNRFLKSITCRLRPIKIAFQNYEQFEGFWSKDIQNNKAIECYMIESRLSVILPKMANLNLTEDPTILKYIASNKKKILLKSKASNFEPTESKIETRPNNVKLSSKVLGKQMNQSSFFLNNNSHQSHHSKKDQNKQRTDEKAKDIPQSLDLNDFF